MKLLDAHVGGKMIDIPKRRVDMEATGSPAVAGTRCYGVSE